MEYFICDNFRNVFFYKEEILNEFLNILNQYDVFDNTLSINKLLNLSCTWDINRDEIEEYLIHILFGSTNKCNWQSEDGDNLYDLNEKDNDSSRLRNLKQAYQIFISN